TNGNPQINKGVKAIPEIFTSLYADVNADDGSRMHFGYRPIVKTTFAIENQFFGNAPHVSHVINILLYFLALLILYRLLRRLLTDYNPVFSLMVVLLFAAHPIHTEVVASLKNRDELLAFIFGFLAIEKFVQFIDLQKIKYVIYGMLLLLLGYLSKASVLIYLAIIPLVIYFFRDVDIKKLVLPFLAVLAALIIARYVPRFFLPEAHRPSLFFENPLLFEDDKLMHISTGFSVLMFYLKKILWPDPLLFYYGFDTIKIVGFGNIVVIISMAIYLALFGIAVYLFRKKHLVSFSLMLFFVTISIYANMVKPVMGIVADRFMFIPVLSLSLLLVYLFFKLFKVNPKNSHITSGQVNKFIVVMMLLLIPYSAVTIDRNNDWEDLLTLTSHDIKDLDNSAKANFLYGMSLKNHIVTTQAYWKKEAQGDVNLMIKHFKKAVIIFPGYFDAWNQLGEIFMVVKKDYKRADVCFKEAIEINSEFRKPYYNLGYLNYTNKKYVLAKKHFLEYLEVEPHHIQTHSFLSKMAFKQKNLQEALEWNKKILEFNPDAAVAYFNMGNFLLQSSDTLKAVENFEIAAKLNPANKQLLNNLHSYFTKEGDESKANYYLNLNNTEGK
ncbi:MAG: tetratricopeptide repeat protein, partial [Bacteroidota bacterium]|nr:tetratricopeptide repeat protein [Bacteroidota bacterium]